MKILFFLQNAYRSERYQFRNVEEWYVDLMRSHSGRRLAQMIPEGVDVAVVNASPIIGDNAKSCYPPDPKHVRRMIRKHKPDIICACGKIAQRGLSEMGIEYVPVPHPAWRALSKEHVARIRQQLGEQNEQ